MMTRNMAIIAITATIIALAPGLFTGRADAQESSSTGASGWFQDCRPAAVGDYDPILAFGQPGGSHRHDFYGNEAASPVVDRVALSTGVQTCSFRDGRAFGNRSLYWVEDLKLRTGQFAGPRRTTAYYNGDSRQAGELIHPFPSDLNAIVRDDNVMANTKMFFACGGLLGDGNSAQDGGTKWDRPHDCDPKSKYPYVFANIQFGSCSNSMVDSEDHVSHLAFPTESGCPASHPFDVPKLRLGVRYNTWQGEGAVMADGDDPATGFHADVMHMFDLEQFQLLIDSCINSGINCNNNPAKRAGI